MIIHESVQSIRTAMRAATAAGERVGLVPTMGFLHEGHAALIREAARHSSRVAVSIFVNPLQFGPSEDFARYPRDLDRDKTIAAQAGATDLFIPAAAEFTPPDLAITVDPGPMANVLCGRSRPGHFRGVCTIVAKLFHAVEPAAAWFGWKDAQQFIILCRMVTDLNLPVEMVAIETIREPDGLAMSSRNVFLSSIERDEAPRLHAALTAARHLALQGAATAPVLAQLRADLQAIPGAALDYAELVSLHDLTPLPHPQPGNSLLAAAIRFSPARLIDNLRF